MLDIIQKNAKKSKICYIQSVTSPIQNTKAGFNYEILDTFEAGLVLLGSEVKALRLGHATISESFIIIEEGELFLVKAYIAPYQLKNQVGYDPYRKRKILISKKEFRMLEQRKQEAGLTLIPLSLYDKGRFLKLQFALARGKNKIDKRNTIKDRDAKREIGRLMKS